MAASRQRRVKIGSNRRTIQLVGIMAIVVGAAIALWFLMFMLDDYQSERWHGARDQAVKDTPVEMR